MTSASGRPHDDTSVRDIEEELSGLRAALEDAVAGGDAAGTNVARQNLVVALASFGSPEFDLEARFHVSRFEAGLVEIGAPGAIAARLVGGDIEMAFAHLGSATNSSTAPDSQLLKLAWSAVLRMGPTCPELPWLTTLVGRIPNLAARGATAAQLVRILPLGGRTSADLADTASECVSNLWPESPGLAKSVLDMICRSLVDGNDQPLLATTARALLRSLPPGNPAERNSLEFLLITSLLNVGDIATSTTVMQSSLDNLRAEAWDRSNFALVASIASNAATAATTALGEGDARVAAEAVAVADRAFELIEQIHAPDIGETEAEHGDTEHRLSVAFSQVLAVVRSLTQDLSLEIATSDPLPFWRFRPGEAGVATVHSPARSARISEARFLEECARVDWKVIPTPQEVDFGLDYRIEIPDTPDRTSTDVEFLVQLKSTNAAPNASGRLTVSIDEKTLKYWKSKVLPTLVVLFHHPTDRFYTSWYFPGLDDTIQRTFRFAREDEWDSITIRHDVQRYYQHMRASLASGGDWSVLAVMQFHCALLIKLLLQQPDIRRAALNPGADLSGVKMDQTTLTLLSMSHRALCAPAPILSGQPYAEDVVKLLRTLDAIVRSWTLAGPQRHPDVRLALVATHLVFKTARDLLHVAVELDCALASAIVEAQEARSAALASAMAGGLAE